MVHLRSRLGGLESGASEPEINMAPLIDMVFILLIFFLVTTTFVREAGVEVQRPTAATAAAKEKGALIVGVTGDGRIFVERRQVDLRSVRGLVERFLAEDPAGAVIIAADKTTPTGRTVAVLDQARLAGAKEVAVAARRPGP
ncbi:MAG: biopolymer transporter ExbD [Desulfarculaceae bacterium]|nr:biopolymer transporter ExbD [Desulfarculaceae bacterium]MCF8072648.1 biopolymer transporter ExbD [Desulfarculaceae bacterium]MCF8102527.1 biopolymer transporter ExbD [Desulfarculaceae bacterium]MCF8117970.1 biopolymer transporter ExbD [Desulfarculaceae bacterium]